MRISEITYNTNIDKFLDYSKVEEEINELETALNSIKSNLIDSLSSAIVIENGGLDPKSFCIEGESLLTNKAKKCKTSFENILETCTTLKTKILDSATNHRLEELTKFISCIEKRIDELEALKKYAIKKIEEASKKSIFEGSISESAKWYINQKKYEMELNTLYEKQDWAKKELGKI